MTVYRSRPSVCTGLPEAGHPAMMPRRRFLAGSAWGLALVSCGLLEPVFAGPAHEAAYQARSFDEALRALGGPPTASDRIMLRLPEHIENGAVVPVRVQTDIDAVEAVYVLAEANPVPVAVGFRLPEGTEPGLSTRIKLNQSGVVHGVVRAAGRLYWTGREATVVRGGCT
jgi:sulfur-oxidizing protein SoxY